MKRIIKNIVKYAAFSFGFLVFVFVVFGIVLTLTGNLPETPETPEIQVEEKESVEISESIEKVEVVKEVIESNPVDQNESVKKTEENETKRVETVAKEVVQEEFEKEKLDSDFRLQFSVWNGSHDKTVKYVKAQMHNPKSFEYVETKYIDYAEKGFRVISMKYRGTNLYNAVITQTIWVNVDLEGNVTKVLKHQ